MTGIGSIRPQAQSAQRLHEMMLARSVATVSQEEALNGAAQSDIVRLAGREQQSDADVVPFSVFQNRAAQFGSQLKSKKSDDSKESQTPECPIEKARAESTTGANAPLNWLVADQFGGEAEFSPSGVDLMENRDEIPVKNDSSDAIFTSQPVVASESSPLLSEEWLLSPCA